MVDVLPPSSIVLADHLELAIRGAVDCDFFPGRRDSELSNSLEIRCFDGSGCGVSIAKSSLRVSYANNAGSLQTFDISQSNYDFLF